MDKAGAVTGEYSKSTYRLRLEEEVLKPRIVEAGIKWNPKKVRYIKNREDENGNLNDGFEWPGTKDSVFSVTYDEQGLIPAFRDWYVPADSSRPIHPILE